MSDEWNPRLPDTGSGQLDCPSCEVTLNAESNFCVNCGADVSALTAGGGESFCPSCGTAVGAVDNFCVNCGEDLDAHREETTDGGKLYDDAVAALNSKSGDPDAVPEELILAVEGYELEIEDGDTIGSEIRAALSEAGRPDVQAVRIHREHVRFIRERDGFYLLDMGENPTHLNGRALQKGDREPVSPGDELELSNVVSVTIRFP